MTAPPAIEGTRALVTGGSGFIGSHVAERLRAEGCNVRITHFNNPIMIDTQGMEVVRADLRDPAQCREVAAGMDYVFMCAAVTSGAAVIRGNPMTHVAPNVVANTQMLEAAHAASVKRFLYISSAAAYPPAGNRPLAEGDMFTGEPYPAYFAAGWMKRYAEILCRTYAEIASPPMSCVVVRPANIYGPRDKFDPARSHVTAAIIRKVVERQDPIEIWGTGEDVRDVIYIDDFVEGLMRAFRFPQNHYVVNIASGRGCRVREIAETAIQVDHYSDARIQFYPDMPQTIPILLIDPRQARMDLGFEAKTLLGEGITRTLAWLRSNGQILGLRL